MADNRVFDSEIERMDGVLKGMREALGPASGMLSAALGEKAVPDEDKVAAEAKRLEAELGERQALEKALALAVAKLAAGIDAGKAEFDNRDMPTRLEKAVGAVSRPAMLRRQRARWKSPKPLHNAGELLKHADAIARLLTEERDVVIEQRKASEAELLAFIELRPDLVAKLKSEDGEALSSVEAVRRVEEFIGLFQAFVDGLNARILTCNVLLHKLSADTEDLLILNRLLFDSLPLYGMKDVQAGAFPHLSREVDLYVAGMLTSHGLDDRRERADRAFAERFPAEASERKPVAPMPVRASAPVAAPAAASAAPSRLAFIPPAWRSLLSLEGLRKVLHR